MNQTVAAFGYPETLLREYSHWVVLLRPEQVTVGTVVIATKSEATQLGDLSPEQWAEFSEITHDFERVAEKVFGAEKFNYFALMMKDPNVHFHAIPRYSESVTLEDEIFTDPDWPLKSELKPLQLSSATWQHIYERLHGEFNAKTV